MALGYVGRATDTRSDGSSTTIVSGSRTWASGSLIVVAVGWGSATTVTGVSGGGNTFQSSAGLKSGELQLWYCENITGGTFSITATFSASTQYRWIGTAEFSGVSLSSSLDKYSTGSGESTSQNTGTAQTLSQNNEVIIGAFWEWDLVTFTEGTWTQLTTDGTDYGLFYKIVSDTGPYQVAVTANLPKQYVSVMGTFKEATGASGNPWYYYAQQMRQKLEEKLKRRILIPGFADCMRYGYQH